MWWQICPLERYWEGKESNSLSFAFSDRKTWQCSVQWGKEITSSIGRKGTGSGKGLWDRYHAIIPIELRERPSSRLMIY